MKQVTATHKNCSKCKKTLSISSFRKRNEGILGLRSECIVCEKLYIKSPKIKKLRTKNQQRWIKNHPEYIEKWRKQNPNYHTNYKKKRKDVDPLFKLECNLRTRIYIALSRRSYRKNTKTIDILGTDINKAKKYIEKQFTNLMKKFGVVVKKWTKKEFINTEVLEIKGVIGYSIGDNQTTFYFLKGKYIGYHTGYLYGWRPRKKRKK